VVVLGTTLGNVTDEQVVKVLRPFVHGTRPVLDALRESDPFRLRARMVAPVDALDEAERSVLASARKTVLDWVSARKIPGTPAWGAMGTQQRCEWWVGRVGRFTALLAAVPGIGGALADRLPVQDALGAAGQGLLLAAIAGEYGIRDDDRQIRLLADVLFQRDVTAVLNRVSASPEDAKAAAELTDPLAESSRRHGRITLRAIAGTVWRMGRMLWGLGEELGKRPQGRWYHKALGMLPVVGILGDYLGERSALRRVAKEAGRWMDRNPTAAGQNPA
jgi:hypothetical protein